MRLQKAVAALLPLEMDLLWMVVVQLGEGELCQAVERPAWLVPVLQTKAVVVVVVVERLRGYTCPRTKEEPLPEGVAVGSILVLRFLCLVDLEVAGVQLGQHARPGKVVEEGLLCLGMK